MGEVQYIWADPSAAAQQAALSSIAQAMFEKNVLAIARWVSRDGMDPKMGVLKPCVFEKVDCLLWCQVSMDIETHRTMLRLFSSGSFCG